MSSDYIKQVEEFAQTSTTPYMRGEVKGLISEMVERDMVFGNERLTVIDKLKSLTSKRKYEIDKNHFNSEEEVMSNRIALNHTIFLINSLLNFKGSSNVTKKVGYKRLVEGVNIQVNIRRDGFIVKGHKEGKLILDRRIGGRGIHSYEDWLNVQEVVTKMDVGILIHVPTTLAMVFECRVPVNLDDYDRVVDKLELALHEAGLTTFDVVGDSLGLYPKPLGQDNIRLCSTYFEHTLVDFKEVVAIANDVLEGEGYVG
ncbi:hypothetical protein ACQUY5_16675 [Bacillus cereus]|uniref:hypothetical protein n=1 Tax=Bacillus cereus TaxID=1396 RepID=UPI003D179624